LECDEDGMDVLSADPIRAAPVFVAKGSETDGPSIPMPPWKAKRRTRRRQATAPASRTRRNLRSNNLI